VADVPSPSDEELLAGSIARPADFALLYDRHVTPLLSFFARRTFDAQTAADLTAETFAEAFASRRRFRNRGAGSASAWLFAIGRHQLSHFVRRQVVEGGARRRLAWAPLVLANEDLERIDELIDYEAVGRTLGAALSSLAGDQREAINLRVIEGRSYAEAARLLGCSQAVVRARVSRGLKRLAADLEP
jgi:RNA polymerase sigma-70 factor (ECF subfamily)